MSRRLTHILLVLVLLLSSEVWAIGLGDIQLDSALNEPLHAEISLLSATPEELASLNISLASAETFARYGIDRPFFLQEIEFNLVGGANGGVVQLRSRNPITEPFLTFLVEATWPSGRLLREYTVLLDPPTFTPAAAQKAPAVSAPSRSVPADSGRIERQQPAAQPQPQPQPSRPAQESRPAPQAPQTPQPARSEPVEDTPYDTSGGGDYVVQRNDTLWGIASRMRPDGRLTMNQTMLAIFEANPGAFGGNINLLRAGASLRIPSADEVFQISRGDAFNEAKRQNEAWSGGYTAPAPTPAPAETRPSLTLVPPDEEPAGVAYDDDLDTAEPLTREQELENRINELESADVPDQPSLIEIRDDELAALRQELANIRGEVYEPPVADVEGPFVDDQADAEVPADDEVLADDETGVDDLVPDETGLGADEVAADDVDAADTEAPTAVVRTAPKSKPGIVDQILGALTSVWAAIAAALVLVAGLLFWFMRRGGEEADESGPWEPLDSDEMEPGSLSSTEKMRAPTPDEAIVVVEQDSAIRAMADETAEIPAPAPPEVGDATVEDSGVFASIEDTFSSDTAVNLDQTDPIAEADFHMAYGLYDQAADLINGALETDPKDTGLMSKLCEIYFVWGNRDAFVDAARNLKSAAGDGESSEWDKTVIMGQQIAADHELFAGADVAAATKAVDLSFDAETGEAGALDMDFGGSEAGASGAIDLGADDSGAADGDLDFLFDESDESTAESPTIETIGTEKTVEMPAPEDTVESPTIDQQAGDLEGTSELPSLDETVEQAIADTGQESEATAEINLDDLDLDIDGLAETELASLEDLDATSEHEALSDDAFADTGAVTGKNPEIDPNSTGVREGLDLESLMDPDATGEMRLASDETGRSPFLDVSEDALDETEVSIDQSLLDATGLTQVLSDDMAVDTSTGVEDMLSDDEATLHASLDEDDDEFDFASTEALPTDVFDPDTEFDETGEMPAVADTDVDLDDLTAALKVSATGDTVDEKRDDVTVEQPRPSISESTAEVPTMSLGPEDMTEDLHEARTMTEVGTKLDLARAYVDMGDPAGARSILEEVLDEGDEGQRQQAQQLLDSLPG
ncbi:MAG: LysM peptidoglycan-binding domain-containing protein [Gammaproteobacteria bacterium]|nr:LysM peptidoglycan-binding domain-containing protein [Gammaproteobacteria bacterium]